MSKQLPLVVVLGATACGKSKLAIELARRFRGEIISADSMQVYHGLDIVTNKVTEDEQAQAKHHLINFVNPLNRFSVVDFRNKSLDLIDDLMKRDTLPIVVGGTNYYIESILWKNFILTTNSTSQKRTHQSTSCANDTELTLIDAESQTLKSMSKDSLHTEDDFESPEKFFKKQIYHDSFKDIASEKLWHILEQVDPESSHIFHPSDKRRIIRILQIIQDTKKPYSSLLKDINSFADGQQQSLGGPLRYENVCVLWLNCDKNILDEILDQRIDQMLDRGLLAELENFYELYSKKVRSEGKQPDYEKGIFQTIGLKEFHEYLILDPEVRGSELGNQILRKCILSMKISTKRYAKKQLSWIERRLCRSGLRQLPRLFKLTTSFEEETWVKNVSEPAMRIVECFLEEKPLDEDLNDLVVESISLEEGKKPGKLVCEACDRVFIGSRDIEIHLKSKNHHRRVTKMKRHKMSADAGEPDPSEKDINCV